jgi:hypothetical protein
MKAEVNVEHLPSHRRYLTGLRYIRKMYKNATSLFSATYLEFLVCLLSFPLSISEGTSNRLIQSDMVASFWLSVLGLTESLLESVES